MNEDERCPVCDGWGWRADPTSRFGPEVPCATCGISGRVYVSDEEMLRRIASHPQAEQALAAILEELRERQR